MQSIQALMTAILMATLALVGAGTSISISDSIITSTTSTTASSTAIGIVPHLSPSANTSSTDCDPCYCDGETWDQLGTWKEIRNALQDSGIVRVTSIPQGYHVSYPPALSQIA